MSQWDVCPSCNLQVDWTSGAGLFMIRASAPTPAASRPSVLNLAIQSPAPQWKEAMPWFIQCAVTLACWSPWFETGKPSLEHKYLMLAMQEGEVNLPNNTRGDFQCTKKKKQFSCEILVSCTDFISQKRNDTLTGVSDRSPDPLVIINAQLCIVVKFQNQFHCCLEPNVLCFFFFL